MKKFYFLSALAALSLTSCDTNKKEDTKVDTNDPKKVHAMKAEPMQISRPGIDNPQSDSTVIVPREFNSSQSCIIDGVLFDDCPLDDIDVGSGPSGGPGGPGPNTPPDFNPLSGSIHVPDPAVIGQPFNFTVVIANEGGMHFPEGSLQPAPGVPFEGVFVHFHILTPQHPQPNASNLVYTGLFDPETPLEGADYILSASFILEAGMVQPGSNHQFAVVVDPGGFVPELDESDNTSFDTETFKVIDNKPDLTPETGGINVVLMPNPVKKTETFKVGCKVKNNGASLSGSFTLKVDYTASLVGGDELAAPIKIASASQSFATGSKLESNALTSRIEKNIVMNLAPGEYTIKATVDPDNTIPELSGGEGNNTAVIGTITVLAAPTTTAKPNLELEVLGMTKPQFRPGKVTQASGTMVACVIVKNTGTADITTGVQLNISTIPVFITSGGSVTSVLGPKDDLKTVNIGSLAAGAERQIEVPIDVFAFRDAFGKPYDLKHGLNSIRWTVDPKDKISNESDETDNQLDLTGFEILAPDPTATPSKEATSFIVDPAAAVKQTQFDVPFTNRGNMLATGFSCEYILREGGGVTLATAKVKYGPGSAFPLAKIDALANSTLPVIFDGDFTIPGKHYTLDVKVDVDNDIMEDFVLTVFYATTFVFNGEKNNKSTIKVKVH